MDDLDGSRTHDRQLPVCPWCYESRPGATTLSAGTARLIPGQKKKKLEVPLVLHPRRLVRVGARIAAHSKNTTEPPPNMTAFKNGDTRLSKSLEDEEKKEDG